MKKKSVLLILVLHRHNSLPPRPLPLDFPQNSLACFLFSLLVWINTLFFFHMVYFGFKQQILSAMYWKSKQLLKGTLLSVLNSLLSSALHLEHSYFQEFYITAELTPKKMTYQHTFFFFFFPLSEWSRFFSTSNTTNLYMHVYAYAGKKSMEIKFTN